MVKSIEEISPQKKRIINQNYKAFQEGYQKALAEVEAKIEHINPEVLKQAFFEEKKKAKEETYDLNELILFSFYAIKAALSGEKHG